MERKAQMQFGEIKVVAREMTVQEVYDLLEGRLVVQGDPDIDVLISHKIDSQLLRICTDADGDTLRQMTPTQLQFLADKIAELNPFFVRLLEKLGHLKEQTQEPSVAE